MSMRALFRVTTLFLGGIAENWQYLLLIQLSLVQSFTISDLLGIPFKHYCTVACAEEVGRAQFSLATSTYEAITYSILITV